MAKHIPAGPVSHPTSESATLAVLEHLASDGLPGDDLEQRFRVGLAAALFFGQIHPGERLPSIRDLAAAGADHREASGAYRVLVNDGTIEVRNRRGAYLAELERDPAPELSEATEWFAGVLAGAAALRIRVSLLPELVRQWTSAVTVHCACLESVEDERVSLVEELSSLWGMHAYPVNPPAVLASDTAAISALDRREPVLLTRAAHRQIGDVGVRLLVPFADFLCADAAQRVAAILIAANLRAVRDDEEARP